MASSRGFWRPLAVCAAVLAGAASGAAVAADPTVIYSYDAAGNLKGNSNTGTDPYNCGAVRNVCSYGSTCCSSQCVDLTTNAGNCGACAAACLYANAAGTCSNSRCALGACSSGYGNCDGSAANGCETNLLTNSNNCGTCGRRCSGTGPKCIDPTDRTVWWYAGQRCASGSCVNNTCSAALKVAP